MSNFLSFVICVVFVMMSLNNPIYSKQLSPSFEDEAQATIQKSIDLYQKGQYKTALNEIQFVVVKHPSYAIAYRLTGLCFLQLHEYDRAIDALRKANELALQQEGTEDMAACIALGRAFFYWGKYEEAIPNLEYATKRQPSDPLSYYLLGFASYKLGKESNAVANLLQAISLNEKETSAWRILAEIYLTRLVGNPGDLSQTLKTIEAGEKLKALEPSVESTVLLGRIYIAAHKFDRAVQELEPITKMKIQDGNLQFNFGLALSRSGQFSKATPVLIKASELLPNNLDVLRELGYVYESINKTTKALEIYRKAIRIDANDKYFSAAIERIEKQLKH